METPDKMNAFQFMMNSRLKVIGSNSPGKEKTETKIKSPEIIEKEKEVLNKRKALFENWSERKGSTKRKLADVAKGKFIDKTLQKRAKRLKNMLNIIDDELNDGIVKSKRKKCPIIYESDSSNDVDNLTAKQMKTNEDNNEVQLSKQKTHKRSLSLKKSKTNENIVLKTNKSDKCQSFSDSDEIFPKNSNLSPCKKTIEFSPKTWRMKVRLLENVEPKMIEIDSDSSMEEKQMNPNLNLKKEVKLAPLFLQKQKQIPKKAKQEFLRSGLPSQFRKNVANTKSNKEQVDASYIFPKISHVQQKNGEHFWNLPLVSFKEQNLSTNLNIYNEFNIGSFSNCKHLNGTTKMDFCSVVGTNLKSSIKEIKMEHPDYPVFKIFRLYYQKNISSERIERTRSESEVKSTKKKRGRPSKKLKESNLKTDETVKAWTEKYRPQSQEEIIGNYSAVKKLKDWLESWIIYSENSKNLPRRKGSDSSDDFNSDTTKDSDSYPQNLIILIGPFGCGKTSTVFALCTELNINIIEINASSRRPGKKILTELQEATQSHQVKNTDNTTSSLFHSTEDNKKLSLLLVEDVDIVFEDQDDGFINALGILATSSKRPIILTSTDKKSPFLQKFISQHTVINFNQIPNKILVPSMQILCLIEGVKADGKKIDELVQFNKGDLRKTVLQLMFWVLSGGDQQKKVKKISLKKDLQDVNLEVDDESSNLLWLNLEDSNKIETNIHENCIDSFVSYYERDKKGFKLSFPINLFELWWTIPSILGFESNQNKSTNNEFKFDSFRNILDQLVLGDLRSKPKQNPDQFFNYWEMNPKDSLSRNENFDLYSTTNETSLEISHWLLENSIKQLKTSEDQISANTSTLFFERRKKQQISMKEVLNVVPAFCILDRNAICLDYQSALRTISRLENQRFAKNAKRKNRFYHYFKSLNLHLDDSTCSTLCNTFITTS